MIRKLLEKAKTFEIDLYRDKIDFIKTHVAFTGTPEQHPYDANRIVLIADPLSTNISYFDFSIADIEGVEELSSQVTLDGKTIKLFRLWVKKGSLGIRSTPFVVEDTRERMKE